VVSKLLSSLLNVDFLNTYVFCFPFFFCILGLASSDNYLSLDQSTKKGRKNKKKKKGRKGRLKNLCFFEQVLKALFYYSKLMHTIIKS